MGKTALLRYFQQRINQDWGETEFGGQSAAVVVYVSFPSQIDRRYMEQLSLSALVDLCKNGVLEASRAFLRLEFLTEGQAEAVLNYGGNEGAGNLLNDAAIEASGADARDLDDKVSQRLLAEGVQQATALALARGQFEDYLRSFRKDGNLQPFYVPHDTRILDYRADCCSTISSTT